MYHIYFDRPVHVHFIGIGGISMSGLAEILFSKGFTISGSDSTQSALTDSLASQGMKVTIGQKAENITPDIDVVVYTAAIHKDNPELARAVSAGVPMLTRAELLGEIMTNYKVAIGVSGTHGKTTTTSMLTELMLAANLDPTVSVGGILKAIGGNTRVGNSGNFITEACEYTNSFLSFFPTIEVILNIEEDHLDFFKDLDDIRLSFKKYVNLLPQDGLLVINGDIDNVEYIFDEAACKVVCVGNSDRCRFKPADLSVDSNGCYSYTLVEDGVSKERIELGVPGIHNVYNSLAAIAVSRHLNIDSDTIIKSLKTFRNSDRRFEKKGSVNGFDIVDDYAHHPSEIDATLKCAKSCDYKRIICIFQPHTYTRTKAFLEDFAKVLSTVDVVVLADIYAAREKNTLGVYSTDIQKLIQEAGTKCLYFPTFDEIEQYILANCGLGDLVITMGAGNIYEVGEHILKTAQ